MSELTQDPHDIDPTTAAAHEASRVIFNAALRNAPTDLTWFMFAAAGEVFFAHAITTLKALRPDKREAFIEDMLTHLKADLMEEEMRLRAEDRNASQSGVA